MLVFGCLVGIMAVLTMVLVAMVVVVMVVVVLAVVVVGKGVVVVEVVVVGIPLYRKKSVRENTTARQSEYQRDKH